MIPHEPLHAHQRHLEEGADRHAPRPSHDDRNDSRADGALSGHDSDFADGKIGEVMVYDVESKASEIKSIFEELAEKTEESFRELKNEMDEFLSKKFKISIVDLKPWHYQDLFFLLCLYFHQNLILQSYLKFHL